MMMLRHSRSIVFSLLGACGSPLAVAQVPGNQDVLSLIRKVQAAPQQLNFSGTFVYQQVNQMRTSRISHAVDGDGEIEKLEILDGRPREYIRRNDEVACYLPDTKTIQIEKQVTQDVFPSVFSGNPLLLPDSYTVRRSNVARVAGIDCDTLTFEPKDAYRYGYRLCVEKSSGFLLRAQTMNEKNEVIEQIAFTQIVIGDIEKNRFKPSFSNVGQWRVENLTVQADAHSGWSVKSLPVGFKKTREIKRLIPLAGNATAATGQAKNSEQDKSQPVIQLTFSDGLATMSVFIERYFGTRTEGSLQQGAMTIMGKRHGDYWLTVVGEVPFAAINQVINSIEFKPK